VINSYFESQVLSADPMQLIEILYRAAIDSIDSARMHLQTGDIVLRTRSITKALEILNELAISLDVKNGGDIARSLSELYDYCARLLLAANASQIDPPLVEVKKLLGTLLEGWQACMPTPFEETEISSNSLCTSF
jgi:flagellar protein FliS